MVTPTQPNPWHSTLRKLSALLIIVVALELAVIAWLSIAGQSEGMFDDSASAASDSELESIEPVDAFSSAIQRSLFSWNRKPGRSTDRYEAQAEKKEVATEWQVTGLVNTGKTTYAIFSELEGTRQLRLEKGMKLEQWSVEDVDTELVTLVRGDQRETYRLSVVDSQAFNTVNQQEDLNRDREVPDAEAKE